MHGWLMLDKPEGITSAHSLNKLKKFVKPYKIGHSGTLDPFASGLLMLAIGHATKLISYSMGQEKSYTFTIKWGVSTDTLDCDGNIIDMSDIVPSVAKIEEFIKMNSDFISQIPPIYSAIKIAGKRAHDMARSGQNFELPARNVELKELILLEHNNDETKFFLRCGKGFYVRSLVRDMAEYCGVLGHTSALRRTKIGDFDVKDAVILNDLLELNHSQIKNLIKPLHSVLHNISVRYISEIDKKKFQHGQRIYRNFSNLSDLPEGSEVAVFDEISRDLLGICLVENGYLQPKKVFEGL